MLRCLSKHLRSKDVALCKVVLGLLIVTIIKKKHSPMNVIFFLINHFSSRFEL